MENNLNPKWERLFLIGIFLSLLIQTGWSIIMGPDIPIVVTWKEFFAFVVFSLLLVGFSLFYLYVQNNVFKILFILLTAVALFFYWYFQLFENTLPHERPITLVASMTAGFGTIVFIIIYSFIRLKQLAINKSYEQ